MSAGETTVVHPSAARSSFRNNTMPWLVCGLGALFYCYEYLLRISPSVMTNRLMAEFNLDAGALGAVIAFYYYIYTPMQLPVGVLMDRYGPKRLLVLACLICALGSFIFGHATQPYMIAVSRLFIGFGSAFAFVGVLKLASIWLPENRFATVSGIALALGMIGAVIGDVVMAGVVERQGWRHTAYYSGLIGIGLAALMILLMRDRPNKQLMNTAVNSAALPETTFKQLLPHMIQLTKNPYIWLNGIIGCLLYLPTSAFAELWGVPYLQSACGFSCEKATSAASMVFLGWAIGGPLVGWISDKLRKRRMPILVGAAVSGVLGSIVIYDPNLSSALLYPLLLVFGVFSAVQVIVFPIGRELSPGNVAGTAVAFTNMLVMIGGVIFQPVIGILLDLQWKGLKIHNVPVYTLHDYKNALLVMPIGIILAFILTLFMKETHAEVKE